MTDDPGVVYSRSGLTYRQQFLLRTFRFFRTVGDPSGGAC